MYKTCAAILALTLSVSALDVSSAEAGRRHKNFANGGNGGNFNVVIGNGNSVGNGGRGGNILSGLLGGGGRRGSNQASGGNGGGFNVVIGNNNTVGNGGNGGNILDF